MNFVLYIEKKAEKGTTSYQSEGQKKIFNSLESSPLVQGTTKRRTNPGTGALTTWVRASQRN